MIKKSQLRNAITEGFVKQFKPFDESLAAAILSEVLDLL